MHAASGMQQNCDAYSPPSCISSVVLIAVAGSFVPKNDYALPSWLLKTQCRQLQTAALGSSAAS
jgi:hypothetical protein